MHAHLVVSGTIADQHIASGGEIQRQALAYTLRYILHLTHLLEIAFRHLAFTDRKVRSVHVYFQHHKLVFRLVFRDVVNVEGDSPCFASLERP